MQTFVARAGQEIGCYEEADLRALYHDGRLLPTDDYWREGMSDWDKLGHLLAPPGSTLPVAELDPPPGWLIPVVIGVGVLFFVLFAGAVGYVVHQKAASRRFVNELQNFEAQQQQAQQKEVSQGGKPTVNPAQLSNELQKLQDISKSESAGDRKLTDETLATLRAISQRSQACRDAEKDMLSLGFGPTRLTSVGEIDRRREAIQKALPTLQGMIDYLTNLDKTVHDELIAKGVSPGAADNYVAGMQRSSKHEVLLTYWTQESAISQDLLANLDLLKDHFGDWHVEDDKVVFNDNNVLAQYRANVEKLKDDIALQQSAQSEIQQGQNGT